MRALLLLLLLAGPAWADEFAALPPVSSSTSVGFLKTWDAPDTLPPCRGVTVCWLGNNPNRPDHPTTPIDLVSITTEQANDFLWGMRSRLYHYSNVQASADRPGSESVAVYAQCYKLGRASCWGMVAEVQCSNPFGGCFAAELDTMANGPVPPGGIRIGLFLPMGRTSVNPDLTQPAVINHAINVVPMGFDREAVRLERGLTFNIECAFNCVQIESGSTISLDSGKGDAEFKFDERTGYMGGWNRRLGCWSFAWHAVRGDVVRTCGG